MRAAVTVRLRGISWGVRETLFSSWAICSALADSTDDSVRRLSVNKTTTFTTDGEARLHHTMYLDILAQQVILRAQLKVQNLSMTRSDVLYIPPMLGAASIILFLCSAALCSSRSMSKRARLKCNHDILSSETDEDSGERARSGHGENTVLLDGATIGAYRVARFLCALALLSLEIHQAIVNCWSWSQVGLFAFYVSISTHHRFSTNVHNVVAGLRLTSRACNIHPSRSAARCRVSSSHAPPVVSLNRLLLSRRLAVRNLLPLAFRPAE
jgi:hypothetical protein